jgi:hypothetical protein
MKAYPYLASTEQIYALTMSLEEMTPIPAPPGLSYDYIVVFEGTFPRKDATLIVRDTKVPHNPSGHFSLHIPLEANPTLVTIKAELDNGTMETQTFGIKFKDLSLDREIKRAHIEKAPDTLEPSTFEIQPSFGYVSSVYQQTLQNTFEQTLLSANLNITYSPKDFPFEFGLSSFYSAFIVSKNTSRLSANLMDFDGYISIPIDLTTFKLDLAGGIFYNSFTASPNIFGYSPIIYPVLYPVISTNIDSRNALALKVIFMPIDAITDYSQRHLEVELTYSYLIANHHAIYLKANYSDIKFSSDSLVELNKLGVSLGFGL